MREMAPRVLPCLAVFSVKPAPRFSKDWRSADAVVPFSSTRSVFRETVNPLPVPTCMDTGFGTTGGKLGAAAMWPEGRSKSAAKFTMNESYPSHP